MPAAGRNEPCPCGPGHKVKRCCGQQRGPSEDQLARAHISILAREVAPDIADLSDSDLDDLRARRDNDTDRSFTNENSGPSVQLRARDDTVCPSGNRVYELLSAIALL